MPNTVYSANSIDESGLARDNLTATVISTARVSPSALKLTRASLPLPK
jgi:hypothetical protein